MASPMVVDSNRVLGWLREMEGLRRELGEVAA